MSSVCVCGGVCTGTSREALEDKARKGGEVEVERKRERASVFLQRQCPLFPSSGPCPESPVLNHWPPREGSPL